MGLGKETPRAAVEYATPARVYWGQGPSRYSLCHRGWHNFCQSEGVSMEATAVRHGRELDIANHGTPVGPACKGSSRAPFSIFEASRP